MSSSSLKLDSLPIEILRRIATFSPCEAILALMEVSRILHRSCNDRLVFKSIIDYHNKRRSLKWQGPKLTIESPTSSWARYALADSKAIKLPTDPLIDKFVSWAPQLAASNHPMVDFPTALSMFTTFASFEWASVDDKQALAFCIGTGLMSKTTDDFSTSQCPQRLKRYLLEPLYEPEKAPELSIENPEMLLQKYVEAIMAVGVFAMLLRDNISRGFILSPHRFKHPGLPPTALIVPNAKDIPFLSMMDLPLPFALTTPRELATCHLPKMTSREFLEDGEWTGFYSISRQIEERVSFDPPMHGIRFSASANDDCPTILYLHATGKDGVEPFDLDGLVEQKSGKVMLTKRYNQFNIWYWSSIMTPYGIVGTWGSRGYGGWVWLWKVGWTNDELNTDAGPLLEEPKQTVL